jgi:hypothetical protein
VVSSARTDEVLKVIVPQFFKIIPGRLWFLCRGETD